MTIKEKSVLRKMKAKNMLRMTMSDDCVFKIMMVVDSMCWGWQDDDNDDDEDSVWDDNESEECVKDKSENEDWILQKKKVPYHQLMYKV